MRNPLALLARDSFEVAKWSRDLVRYTGSAALERIKAFNPRAIQAQNMGYAHWLSPINLPQPDQKVLSETETTQPIVWRCIEVPAEDASKVPLLMFEGTPEDRGDQLTGDAHPMLELLRRPAPDVSATVWRQNIYTDIRAAGDWFSYVYMGSNGMPASFARFLPGEITPQPDLTGRRLIDHYDWRTLDGQGTLGVSGIGGREIPVDDMAHIKTRNPNTELRGLGALSRLRFQISMDKVMQEWNWGRYAAGIPTQYMVFFNGQFGEGQREQVEQDLRRKISNPGGDNFLLVEGDGQGGSEFRIDLLPRPTEDELAFLDSEQRIAIRIIMAFGVPPLKIMDLSQSSVLANTEIQERLYWEDTVPSLHAHFLDWANSFARKYYFAQGPVFFEFDYSAIRALKKSEQEQMQTMTGYTNAGVLTRNEVREAIGWSPVEATDPRYVEGLDQFLVGNSQVGKSPLMGLVGPPTAGDDEEDEEEDGNDDEPMDEFPGDEDDEGDASEGAAKVVRLRSKGFENLMGMIDLEAEKERFDKTVRRKLLAMMRASGEQTLEGAGVVGSFDWTHPKVFEFLETQTIELVEQVITNTNNAVRSAVADGLAQGDAIPAMRRRVQDAFEVRREPWQLDRISRTEVHAAQEGGGHLAAEQNGVEMKLWVTARDSRVRGLEVSDKADHDGIEAQGPIPLGVPFVDPRSGAKLMFPGDRSGAMSGADTIGCRCTAVADFSHIELSARPGRRKGLDEQWFAKNETADRWVLDFARTLKGYFIGMQRRALGRFDVLIQEGSDDVRAATS